MAFLETSVYSFLACLIIIDLMKVSVIQPEPRSEMVILVTFTDGSSLKKTCIFPSSANLSFKCKNGHFWVEYYDSELHTPLQKKLDEDVERFEIVSVHDL